MDIDPRIYDVDQVRAGMPLIADPAMRRKMHRTIHLVSEHNSLELQLAALRRRIGDFKIVTESESHGAMKDGAVGEMKTEQNVTDVAGSVFSSATGGVSVGTPQGQDGLLDMGDFLSRPVQIYEGTIALGANLSLDLDPWNLFTLEPSVRAKLRNHAYFRGDLHVRIAVSGSPFHTGRLLVSYQPYPIANEALISTLTAVTGDSNLRPNLLAYLSQAPGAFYMNINANAPLEISLPFISPKAMHRLFNDSSTAIGSGTSFVDFFQCGELYLYTMSPIAAVSATVSPISFQVYAWMDKVELGVSTGTQLTIVTESELEKGPIEKISSRVQKVTSSLASLPGVGPWMSATSLAAGAVRKFAALLGWSKPVLTADPPMVRLSAYTSSATTIGTSTAERIVLDPQQQLTVSPHSVGVDHDDMVIASIAARPSFVSSFVWADSNTPLDYIWSAGVTPCISATYVTVPKFIQPSCSAFAALPFQFWRGDVTFTFDVVCSQFHRGKIAVFFEPNLAHFNLINADLHLNKQLIQIIDIQDTQTFSVTVQWASPRSWLKTLPHNVVDYALDDPANVNYRSGYYNGYIGVMPFTALQSPDDSDVTVLVSVHCDNLQVNGINESQFPLERIITESESDSVSKRYDSEVSTLILNPSSASADAICCEHFGEQPLSFRSLLKRFVTGQLLTASTGSGTTYTLVTDTLPLYPTPLVAFGGSAATYNDFFSYVRFAYMGMRGGMRYRRCCNMSGVRQARVSLLAPSDSNPTAAQVISTGNYLRASVNGSHPTTGDEYSALEFEIPFYSNNLWVSTSTSNDISSDSGVQELTWYRSFKVESLYTATTSTVRPTTYDMSTAEDFTFLRFQGAPYYSYSV